MNNEIIINNIEPQSITIEESGSVVTGITKVYVNGVDVTVGSKAYVIVPTKTSELTNDSGFITSETDPTVPSYVKSISQADINAWNNKQNLLVSGTTIKTINSESLLGSGNLLINEYVAGTGIDITNHTISNTITSYNDLTDLPTIPNSTSQLTNDSNFAVTNSSNEFTGNQEITGNLLIDGETNTNQYSDSEILSGKWIDGSDLYRLTFQTTLADNDTVTINTGLTDVEVYNIIGSANNGISVYPINYYNSSSHDRIETYYDSGNIYITTNFDASGYTGFVTLEYIKI